MIALSFSNDNRFEFLEATCDPTACQTIVNDEAAFVSRLKSLLAKYLSEVFNRRRCSSGRE